MMKKIPYDTCGPIISRFALSEEGAALITPETSTAEAVTALTTPDTLFDLIQLIAHGLPPREGICWALTLLADAPMTSPDAVSARNTVRLWVEEPAERARRRCADLAEALGTDNPFGWLCHAVFWNGSGSIVAPDLPVVLPQPYLHAKALLGAVGLLAPLEEPDRTDFATRVAQVGVAVADGAWPCLEEAR
ncbi:hypothetical protein HJ526_18005 [Donghicola sp. C2-DW-16]|uniref:Uncharacterized protein n=1 Tax=Donghicola mangrovi TaxID=2729614 RepID=A0ABX2PIN2_9RHOB|nr:hypothetical protein [Donghicola mangrovi]NVO29319.1 hypothetical protein [Donghicola mangrovi]